MDIQTVGSEVAYVGQGIAFPRVVELRTTPDDQAPVDLTFTVVYEETSRRYLLEKVSIGEIASGKEITGQFIRSIQFQDFLLKGLSRLKYLDMNTHEFSKMPALSFTPKNRDEMIKQGPTTKTLETVALLYRIAEVLNANQGKHIEHVLNIPYATAANWISRARKQGAFESIADPSKVFPKINELPVSYKPDSFI